MFAGGPEWDPPYEVSRGLALIMRRGVTLPAVVAALAASFATSCSSGHSGITMPSESPATTSASSPAPTTSAAPTTPASTSSGAASTPSKAPTAKERRAADPRLHKYDKDPAVKAFLAYSLAEEHRGLRLKTADAEMSRYATKTWAAWMSNRLKQHLAAHDVYTPGGENYVVGLNRKTASTVELAACEYWPGWNPTRPAPKTTWTQERIVMQRTPVGWQTNHVYFPTISDCAWVANL